jgi:hypothetical protein
MTTRIKTASLADSLIHSSKIADNAVTDSKLNLTSTSGLDLPVGTTAQRPGSPGTGNFRFNTTFNSIEFWNGSAWLSTHLIPVISALSGTIQSGSGTTLTLTVSDTTSTINIIYKVSGSEVGRNTGISVSSGSASCTVPSGVHGQSIGATVVVSIENTAKGNVESSTTQSKVVQGVATGGTVSTYSSGGTNYKVHKFTSSGNLVVPTGLTLSNCTILIIAGGGGSGAYGNGGGGGGGGGGGFGSPTVSSLTAGTHSITIGGGGAQHAVGSNTTVPSAFQGNLSNTHFNGGTFRGGGQGAYGSNAAGGSGGSGGGGNPRNGGAGGVAVAGQGNIGGSVGALNQNDNGAAGGGGAGGAASNASWTNSGSGGGAGVASTIVDGSTSVTYGAGGRGGNGTYHGNTGRVGGANIGEGAWGPKASIAGYAGGSGIVIIRYTV